MYDINEELTVSKLHVVRVLRTKGRTFNEINSILRESSSSTAEILRDLEKRGFITKSWRMISLENGKSRIQRIYEISREQIPYRNWLSTMISTSIQKLCPHNMNENHLGMVCM